MQKTASGFELRINEAIDSMLSEFRGNQWMLNEHWPLMSDQIRQGAKDLMQRIPPDSGAQVLDLGCGNGYVSWIFNKLGYRVTGVDVSEDTMRQQMFEKANISFLRLNLNSPELFERFPDLSFDGVLVFQLIEHILNHPLGLMQSLSRLMRSKGVLILTTPNPATLMSALRTIRGVPSLWGTHEFIEQPKINRNSEIISYGEIHYREYTKEEMESMCNGAGLIVECSQFLGLGVTSNQQKTKQILKRSFFGKWLMSSRLFGSNHYFVVRKP